jgi:hypothetical protein
MRWALAAAALASAIAFVTLRGNDSPEQFAPLDPRAQDAPAESAADESAAEEADEATTDTPPSPAPTAVERPAPEPPANNHALPIGPRRAVVVGPRKRQPSPATQARPAKRADTPETSSKRPAVGRADWPRDGSWQLSVDQGNP